MPSDPKRPPKPAKKHSISGQRRRREKKVEEAETAAPVSSIPGSQSSRRKPAINPAKCVEANDGLHFDNQAEWDAYLQSLKPIDAAERLKHEEAVKTLEQRIDLAPLIRAAESGVWEACWKLWYVAKQATGALNNIAEKQPELFHGFARRCFEWPGVISRNPYISADNQRFLEKLQQGEDLPFVNIPKGKKGRTLSFKVRANVIAFKLYSKIEILRNSYDYTKSGVALPSWIQGAIALRPFSAETCVNWAEIAWQMLLEATDGKPEQDEDLRPLGESAGRKKPHWRNEPFTEEARNRNVQGKIRERLFEAFRLNARQ